MLTAEFFGRLWVRQRSSPPRFSFGKWAIAGHGRPELPLIKHLILLLTVYQISGEISTLFYKFLVFLSQLLMKHGELSAIQATNSDISSNLDNIIIPPKIPKVNTRSRLYSSSEQSPRKSKSDSLSDNPTLSQMLFNFGSFVCALESFARR